MTFLIQFLRLRRGVLEVVHSLYVAAADGSAALAQVQSLVGPGPWPMRTDALRILDDRGRKLIDWMVPVETAQPAQSLVPLREPIYDELRPAPSQVSENLPVSYAEDGKPESWKGGYEIVRLCDPGTREARYAIRNADQSYDRIVQEHELREDLGARVRGR